MTLNITWYGHSCIAINTVGLQLLVDPFDLIKQDPHQWAQAVTDQTETIAIVLQPGDSVTV